MIRVKHDNQYLSYMLDDNSRFFLTGFRVLRKQKDKGFLPCSKISYNGHIKLLYPIEEYVSVLGAAEEWNAKDVLKWMIRILKVLIEVRDSGFLRLDDVDLDLSHIFVDTSAEKVHIVVLPLTAEAAAVNNNWEQALNSAFILLIEVSGGRNEQGTAKIKQIVLEYSSSIDLLLNKLRILADEMKIQIRAEKSSQDKEENGSAAEEIQGELHLITRNSLNKMDIAITKDVFVLGKSPKLCDQALALSPTISREHCIITREKNGYFIKDAHSLNHTYVNGEMLKKGEKARIQKGTRIRLAEVEFSVEFR